MIIFRISIYLASFPSRLLPSSRWEVRETQPFFPSADIKLSRPDLFGVTGRASSGGHCCLLVLSTSPRPKAVTNKATIMIVFRNFNLSRLLSEQVAVMF
jgi:hypothetical protein